MASGVTNYDLQQPSTAVEETICALQEELAETNRGLMALSWELEQRVDERTTQLRAAHEELQRTNAELVQFTLELEDRVAQRTEEIRRLNEELERRVEERTAELAMVNKELEAFSYSVSHDLRAPLRAIDGFSKVLLNESESRLSERDQDFLRKICASAERMRELIEGLLNLSRWGRRPLSKRPTNLASLVRQVF